MRDCKSKKEHNGVDKAKKDLYTRRDPEISVLDAVRSGFNECTVASCMKATSMMDERAGRN